MNMDKDNITLPREALVEFFGTMALPPWEVSA